MGLFQILRYNDRVVKNRNAVDDFVYDIYWTETESFLKDGKI